MIEGLGENYRDSFTGFSGWAIARTVYLDGHVQVCLVRADSNGKPEEVWVPEHRLELLRKPAVGFDRPTPAPDV